MTDRNNRNEEPEAESVEYKIPKRGIFAVIKGKLLGGITGVLGKFKKSKKEEKPAEDDERGSERRPGSPQDGRADRPMDGRTERPNEGMPGRPNEGMSGRPSDGRPGRPSEEDEGKTPEKPKLKLGKLHFVVIGLSIVAIAVIILAGVMYKKASAINSAAKHIPIVTEAPKVTDKEVKPSSVEDAPPNGFDWVTTTGIKFAKPVAWEIDPHARRTGNSSLLETLLAHDVKNTHLSVFAFKHNMTKTERIAALKVSQLNEICTENGATSFKVIEFKKITVGKYEALETLFYYTLGENRYMAYQISVPMNNKDYVFTVAYRNGSTSMDVEMILKLIVNSLHIN